jgi:hypothetical protein
MDDPADASAWTAGPSVKAKNAVQRNVVALLDELAPQKELTRGDRIKLRVEQHRTPTGCVLQAATAALTVSWFGEADSNAPFGELHVVVWRGVVTRRGAPPIRDGATVLKELVLFPIEPPSGDRVWRTTDGKEYGTATLAAECLALIEEQTAKGEAERGPPKTAE